MEKEVGIRLNKFIAASGLCSRRKADELIQKGFIKVNGKVVKELGVKVQPDDTIEHEGKILKGEKLVYVLLNKPKDFVTTTDDPQNRRTVMHLVAKAAKERIYPVGRLDRNTTGLLLFTNDGEMAKKLTHPSHGVEKLYHVTLNNPLSKEDIEKIKKGLSLEDGPVKVDSIDFVNSAKNEVGVAIHLGRNRIIRRLFESLNYEVVKLDRVVFAGLTKVDLPRGNWRYLSEKEVRFLKMV